MLLASTQDSLLKRSALHSVSVLFILSFLFYFLLNPIDSLYPETTGVSCFLASFLFPMSTVFTQQKTSSKAAGHQFNQFSSSSLTNSNLIMWNQLVFLFILCIHMHAARVYVYYYQIFQVRFYKLCETLKKIILNTKNKIKYLIILKNAKRK